MENLLYYSPKNIYRRKLIKRNFPEWSTFSFTWKFCGYNSSVLVIFEDDMFHMLDNSDLHMILIKYYETANLLVDYLKKQKRNFTTMELDELKRSFQPPIETFKKDFQSVLERRLHTLEINKEQRQ